MEVMSLTGNRLAGAMTDNETLAPRVKTAPEKVRNSWKQQRFGHQWAVNLPLQARPLVFATGATQVFTQRQLRVATGIDSV
jgi:hypothetical protein